ncbi:MAG: hypothetical protein A2015_14295 [Spirochaetes bacterium GWF1_31_7]|nr:MAG: hypothetical protein A2Y30_03455 [Spirochaetes bacterium GWE1_32_154]OHD45448.1 MAG: hypothetical protein A2Y29_01365 [Spirochaetes bacterium GWE2_31_10]OHD50571.1 MAG: hypothetical protein A2015_14295 [Spirochaetes bacterium GWF1_31_7]OHD81550.1 MAG: hypothetical protein A2355_02365 [Spirochaetes bacterium RIFOXYB1_FULL_32_8]HBD94575.1 chemotaxis response regulator protein-glutamate methylesterase [Spirochaetia bacterium]
MNKRIKVFNVDDSPIYRQVLKDIISSDPNLEYMGFAANGAIAVKKLELIDPDVITLDIEMPEMNGIETLKYIMKNKPKPVIMISSFTKDGADITLQALEIGAVDYIQKPEEKDLVENINSLSNSLLSKIKMFSHFKFDHKKFKEDALEDGLPIVGGLPSYDVPRIRTKAVEVLCIGSSTGGTVALTTILPRIDSKIGIPIVIVQHMPRLYTKSFADRLNTLSSLTVVEGQHGDKLQPNMVYIAPGGFQTSVKNGRLVVEDADPVNNHKPSVDVLFESIKKEYRDRSLAVILTGMGSDGAKGIAEIKDAGGFTVAQDEESSIVFGMPGSAIKTGKIDRIIPLDKIANFINEAVEYSKN